MTMAHPEKVVEKAISDSFNKKEVSVYGSWIKVLRIVAKIIPHKLLLIILRFIK